MDSVEKALAVPQKMFVNTRESHFIQIYTILFLKGCLDSREKFAGINYLSIPFLVTLYAYSVQIYFK